MSTPRIELAVPGKGYTVRNDRLVVTRRSTSTIDHAYAHKRHYWLTDKNIFPNVRCERSLTHAWNDTCTLNDTERKFIPMLLPLLHWQEAPKPAPPMRFHPHFEPEMIILCVRRYLRFCFRYRGVESRAAYAGLYSSVHVETTVPHIR